MNTIADLQATATKLTQALSPNELDDHLAHELLGKTEIKPLGRVKCVFTFHLWLQDTAPWLMTPLRSLLQWQPRAARSRHASGLRPSLPWMSSVAGWLPGLSPVEVEGEGGTPSDRGEEGRVIWCGGAWHVISARLVYR